MTVAENVLVCVTEASLSEVTVTVKPLEVPAAKPPGTCKPTLKLWAPPSNLGNKLSVLNPVAPSTSQLAASTSLVSNVTSKLSTVLPKFLIVRVQPIDAVSSYKTTIVATSLCGTVVWMAYRAYLNAELALIEKKYPFDDMESFSKTNWR